MFAPKIAMLLPVDDHDVHDEGRLGATLNSEEATVLFLPLLANKGIVLILYKVTYEMLHVLGKIHS